MLINLRNALMAGKRLPYDAEVEFLESTGTQWIDTGVAFSDFYTFQLSARLTPTYGEMDLFGAYAATETNKMVCGVYRNFVFGFNPPNARIDSATIGSTETDISVEYRFSSTDRALTVNGTTYTSNGAATNGLNVTLFKANPSYMGVFKCRSFKIYAADGTTLVRDYIPVRRGTVGYLYDRVSGKLFGNAGTGDFVLGQDVVPVEYIESHGTQWIDTGVYGNSDTVAELSFAMTDSARVDAGIFGSRKGYQQDCFTILRVASSQGAFWMHYGSESTSANYISTVIGNTTAWHTARLARSWSIDSSTGTAGQYTFTTPTTLKAFAADMSASSKWYAKMRLALLKIYSNNTLARKFLSVRVGTEGAMMDVLTRRIYRNQGTGAFGYGNDLKYPIPAS